jgi:hypothetical protein
MVPRGLKSLTVSWHSSRYLIEATEKHLLPLLVGCGVIQLVILTAVQTKSMRTEFRTTSYYYRCSNVLEECKWSLNKTLTFGERTGDVVGINEADVEGRRVAHVVLRQTWSPSRTGFPVLIVSFLLVTKCT